MCVSTSLSCFLTHTWLLLWSAFSLPSPLASPVSPFPLPVFPRRGCGCILYEMVCGRPMFPGATVEEELTLIWKVHLRILCVLKVDVTARILGIDGNNCLLHCRYWARPMRRRGQEFTRTKSLFPSHFQHITLSHWVYLFQGWHSAHTHTQALDLFPVWLGEILEAKVLWFPLNKDTFRQWTSFHSGCNWSRKTNWPGKRVWISYVPRWLKTRGSFLL